MSWPKHIGFWIIAILVLLLSIPIFSTPPRLWQNASDELQAMSRVFGYNNAKWMTESANGAYQAIFVDTGFVQAVKKGEISNEERHRGQELFGGTIMAMTALTNNYVLSFSALIYVMMIRVLIVLSWAPYVMPFLLAAGCDGWVRRQMKMASIRGQSTVRFSVALHAMIVIMMAPVLYVLAPLYVSPLFIPAWAIVAAVPLVVLMSNIQPMSQT